MDTLYVPGSSFVHRLDPRTKMLILLASAVLAFVFYDPIAELAVFFPLLLMVVSAGLLGRYLGAMKFLVFFMVFVSTIHGLWNPMGGEVVLRLSTGLAFKYGGLLYGTVMATRILTIGTAALLFVMTTRPADFSLALLQTGVPHSLTFMLTATFQIIPMLAREAKIVMEAQQARCLDVTAGIRERMKNLIPVLVPLFVIAFIKVHQLSYVLECRGFSARCVKTHLREIRFRPSDYVVSILTVAAAGYAIYQGIAGNRALYQASSSALKGFLFAFWVATLGLIASSMASWLARRTGRSEAVVQ
ncbi:MAG: energy-coupling factor transporter transmembrane protein EcfT [Actinobacteria bacterium]|nr:energy-coupling factor transporter transmembrane protein EcfT [Actinomycetota bacterium]